MFANLNRLRAAGLYRDALAYHDLGAVRVTDRLGAREQARHRSRRDARAERRAGAVPRHQEATAARTSRGAADPPLVQWDTPIPPPEAYGILAKMSAFKEATVYKVGRELSRQGRLGDGSDAADRGVALVAGQADDDEADDRLLGAAARERSLVHEPRAADGGAAADRSRLPRETEQGQRRRPSDHERGRRAARLRPAEDQPDLHAARRLSRIARRRRHRGAVGCRSDLSGERHPPEDLAHLAARHLPQPARLPVARVGADVLRVRGLGAHALGRDARLLDDARLVDARVRLAGRCAVSAAQGRADEAARR